MPAPGMNRASEVRSATIRKHPFNLLLEARKELVEASHDAPTGPPIYRAFTRSAGCPVRSTPVVNIRARNPPHPRRASSAPAPNACSIQ